MVAITFLMALYNWYDEGHFQLFQTNFLAITGSSLAIIVSTKSSKKCPRLRVLYTIAAYFLVALGLLVYTVYALNGPADSLHSAAHMHIIIFPMIHITLTIFSLAIIEVIGIILNIFSPKNKDI